MKLIHTILQRPCFHNEPPVLIDVGASGEIHAKWAAIAPYSICIAFDADDRDFTVTEATNKTYRKLITFNRIVTATPTAASTFYLTASPYCSSLLKPDLTKLAPWLFSSLFKVERATSLPTITLEAALTQSGLNYADWLKTDTQGTDLRVFKSLPPSLQQGLKIVELEPGIIDAYDGEDKLHTILRELPEAGFWLSDMVVKGTQRLHEKYIPQFGQFASSRIQRTSPCWAELSWLREARFQSERDILLLIVFALLEKQWGFALEVIDNAGKLPVQQAAQDFPAMLQQCREAVHQHLRNQKLRLPWRLVNKKLSKLFSRYA